MKGSDNYVIIVFDTDIEQENGGPAENGGFSGCTGVMGSACYCGFAGFNTPPKSGDMQKFQLSCLEDAMQMLQLSQESPLYSRQFETDAKGETVLV